MVKTKRNLLLVILSVVFALTLISFVAAKPVNAEDSAITMKEVASVRLDHYESDGRSGIRFTGYVDKDVVLSEAVDGVFAETDTYAGIIVAKGAVDVADLTHELLSADDYIDVPAARFDPYNDTELGRAFNAVIWGIPEVAYAQTLTARAYIYDNGTYTYSDNICARSLAQVASGVLVNDNPVGEDLLLLQQYVDGANAQVLVNGVAFGADEYTMDVEVMQYETISVDLNYEGFTFVLETLSEDVSIDGKDIIANNLTESAVVYITVGTRVYTLNIKVIEFADLNREGGILADFDEPGYINYVSKNLTNGGDQGGRITMLTGKALADENIGAETGVLKFWAEDYDRIDVMFQETFQLNEITNLYIKYRTNKAADGTRDSQFRYDLLGTDGARLGSSYLYITNAIVNEWVTLGIPVSTFSAYNQNLDIGGIHLYWIKGTHYVDEIGCVKGVWEDTELNDGVVADFNEEKYIFNVISGNNSGPAGVPSILLGEEATAVGADSGVVSVALNNWNFFDIKVQETFKLSEIDSITLKVKYSNYQNLRFALYDADGVDLRPYTVGEDDTKTFTKSFSEGGGVPKITTILTGTNPVNTTFLKSYQALTDNEWATISIPSYMLTKVYEADREVATIRIYNNIGSVQQLYLDEIKINKIVSDEVNALVAEDFNGLDVVGKPYVLASSVQYDVDFYTGSLGALYGAKSGVIAFNGSGYFNIHMPVAPTYSISETGGIYITMKHSNASQNIGQMRLYLYDEAGNAIIAGKYFREFDAKYTDGMTTDWVTVEITAARLAALGATTDVKIGKFVINSISAGIICVDEIGYLAKAE